MAENFKEQGGTKMPTTISSVGSVAGSAPVSEIHRTQAVSAERRAEAIKFAASLPGSDSGKSHTEEISRLAADLETVSRTFNKRLQFVVDPQSHEVIVKVVDQETNKVIKVIPPEELQRLHKKLKETIGFLFNERV
jgi:flagellar protein FlaG